MCDQRVLFQSGGRSLSFDKNIGGFDFNGPRKKATQVMKAFVGDPIHV